MLAPRWPFGCLIAVAIADVGVTGCNFGEAASWFGVVLMLPGVGAMLAVQLLPTRRRAATAGESRGRRVDRPVQAEGIAQHPSAVAPELALERPLDRAAGSKGARPRCMSVTIAFVCTCSPPRALARRFNEAFCPLGITNGQFWLIMALNQPAPPPMGRIAAVLEMDRTTLTAALKPLERRGLVIGAASACGSERCLAVFSRPRMGVFFQRDSG